jgi:hypothetical protein
LTLKDLVQQAEAAEVEVAEALLEIQAIQVLLVQQEMLVQLVRLDPAQQQVILVQVATLAPMVILVL